MTSSRRILAGSLAAALFLGACTGGASDDPTQSATTLPPLPTRTSEPVATPTPTPVATPSATPSPVVTPTLATDDLSAIADDGEVTIAEAQAVVDAQMAIFNPALIEWLIASPNSQGISPAFTDAIFSINTDESANLTLQGWQALEEQGLTMFNIIDPDGLEETVTTATAGEDCFALSVVNSTRNTRSDVTDLENELYIEMVRAEIPRMSNTFGWVRQYESPLPPEDPVCPLGGQ